MGSSKGSISAAKKRHILSLHHSALPFRMLWKPFSIFHIFHFSRFSIFHTENVLCPHTLSALPAAKFLPSTNLYMFSKTLSMVIYRN